MSVPVPPPLYEEPPELSRRRRVARFLVVLAIVVVVGTGSSWWWRQQASGTADSGVTPAFAAQSDTMARAPSGVRVRVRVVNTTKTDGLAKRATALLRDRGFDVVDYVSETRKTLDTTLVLTHTGHSDWSARAVRALGAGVAETRADTLHYLDLTVMLGRDWKAPAQPFRP